MRCQAACPKNRGFINKFENEVGFSEDETEAILDRTPIMQLSDNLRQKLDKLDLAEYYEVLFRNLDVLIK